MKRKLIIALALCLALALGIGGTMAYLTATTTAVVNTFTIGNVGLKLVETENEAEVTAKSYKIVPGETVDKDPTVTVKQGSEACWLFVKVTEDLGTLNDDISNFFSYEKADGWQVLTGEGVVGTVYYRSVNYANSDISFHVLKEDHVTLSQDITLDMSTKLTAENAQAPTLTFKAAAVQSAGLTEVLEAYKQISTALNAAN